MIHHSIIVTSYNDEVIGKLHKKANEIFNGVSDIVYSPWNAYRSFFIPPDGSKDGWDASDIGDRRRKQFINCIEEYRFDDGSTSVKWVEVQFGSEFDETKVCDHSEDIKYTMQSLLTKDD